MNHNLFSKTACGLAATFALAMPLAAGATQQAEIEAMSRSERAALTSLTLTGDVSPEVLVIIRDEMVKLTDLNLSGAAMTEIPPYAFAGKSVLANVMLPAGITSIGDGAFMTCPALQTITLPSGVTSIGKLAFARGGLTSFTIGAKTTEIGNNAFFGCKNLASIEVAEGNANYCSIDGSLYTADKTRLILHPAKSTAALNLPEETTAISDYACMSSTSIAMPAFPAALTSIGDYAFQNCKGFSGTLSLPAGLVSVGKGAFFGCTGISGNLNLASAAAMGTDYSYAYLTSLSAITLPSTATEVAPSAFELCSGVTAIRVEATEPPAVGDMAFRGIDRFSTFIDVADEAVEAYKNAPVWSEFDNYEAPMSDFTFTLFNTDGKYRIKYVGNGPANGKYITFASPDGAAPQLSSNADNASIWELEFFTVPHTSLPYVGEPGSDIRFFEGDRCKHINHAATCWNDSKEGYYNNPNRSFAFYMALAEGEEVPASPVVAIRGNGTIWGANAAGTQVVANSFSAPKPGLSSFVWLLESTVVDSITEISTATDSRDAVYYNINGIRVASPSSPGVYIAVGSDGKTSKIIL